MTDTHKSCACFGHSKIEITETLKMSIRNTFEKLITSEKVNIFYFGGFGQFDNLCYQIVSELKTKYPTIQRIFCTADKRWLRASKRPQWLRDEEYEEITYFDLDFDYWYTRIYYRNCAIIDRSNYVVFYIINTKNSGAYKALQYAKKKKKQIIYIVSNTLL